MSIENEKKLTCDNFILNKTLLCLQHFSSDLILS